jgi:hypothetical protein
MKAANLDTSERLKRVKKLLKDRREYSTLEIIRRAKVCAVNSIISELRANGLSINCQRKGDRWFYRMVA